MKVYNQLNGDSMTDKVFTPQPREASIFVSQGEKDGQIAFHARKNPLGLEGVSTLTGLGYKRCMKSFQCIKSTLAKQCRACDEFSLVGDVCLFCNARLVKFSVSRLVYMNHGRNAVKDYI